MIIGTAGHIDHGKTSLVKALTGIDADRLPEEKARGITLDLGYAYAPCSDSSGRRLAFIDVPGHERLVHNMLVGATGIDFLLLIIAADDGPMPQTREHLAIAELLGITHAAVALTKCDAVTPERQAAASGEVAALLAGSPLATAPLFPVSARSGEGIAALRAHLEAQQAPVRSAANGHFRLAIDRCFTIAGAGTIVTGTVFSGQIQVGDTLTVSPPGFTARVRGLRVLDLPAESGSCGQRVAVNLAGDFERTDIRRGHWLLAPAAHAPLTTFAAELTLANSEPHALRHWTPVHLHLGAEDVTARIVLLAGDTLAPGESMLVELICTRAIGTVIGDRFILRDAAATRTLGGGRVLDPQPPARHKRQPARMAALAAALAALRNDDPGTALSHAITAAATGLPLSKWAQAWNLDPGSAEAAMSAAGGKRVATADGGLLFSDAHWQGLAGRLDGILATEHERTPDLPGVEHERLRRMTLPTLSRAAFDALLDEALAAGRIERTGSWLHRPGHRVTLAEADLALWQTLAPLLDVSPFNPPRVRDIAAAGGLAEETVRGLCKRVARTGILYPVAHDHYFSADAVAALARQVATLCSRDGSARAAALRDEIGGGRKVAIHILEFFDRIGYTRRVRDTRGTRDEHRLRPTLTPTEWGGRQ